MGAVHASRTAFSASAHSPQGLRDLCWALIIHKRFPFARDHRQHNQRLGREQAQNGLMKDVAQGIKKRGVLLRLNLPCVTQRVRRQRCDVSARCSRAPTCAGQRNSSWILLAARFLDPERLPSAPGEEEADVSCCMSFSFSPISLSKRHFSSTASLIRAIVAFGSDFLTMVLAIKLRVAWRSPVCC